MFSVFHRRTQSVGHEPLRRQGSSTTSRPPQPLSAQAVKHIWVRTALFEKVLDKVVQYIVDNSRWSLSLALTFCLVVFISLFRDFQKKVVFFTGQKMEKNKAVKMLLWHQKSLYWTVHQGDVLSDFNLWPLLCTDFRFNMKLILNVALFPLCLSPQ